LLEFRIPLIQFSGQSVAVLGGAPLAHWSNVETDASVPGAAPDTAAIVNSAVAAIVATTSALRVPTVLISAVSLSLELDANPPCFPSSFKRTGP
jgi:hypothetical protein